MCNEKKFSYVYKITNVENGQYYIGLRSCNCNPEEDAYFGSGIKIQLSIKKYGLKTFKKEIIKVFKNRVDASLYEQELVNEDVLKDQLCLNLKVGGEYILGEKFSDEIKEKISIAIKNYYTKPENRQKTSEAIKKAFLDDPEYGLKISKARKQMCEDSKYVQMLKERLWGNEEVINKRKESLKTKEAIEKKSKSLKEYSNTIEGRRQKSQATKGKIYINKDKVTKRINLDKLESYLILGWVLGNYREISVETSKLLSNTTKGKKFMYHKDTGKLIRVSPELISKMELEGWILGNNQKKNHGKTFNPD